MRFDNQQFETAAKKSITTLDKLKSSLKLENSAKGLTELDSAARKVNFSGLTNGLEAVRAQFSATQVMGITALANLTNSAINTGKRIASALVSPMVEGGKRRALNIAQAKFQFEGLGMDVEKAMESASEAVDGTAYGLDAAAKAASMFGASGIEAGEKMTKALRGISGVAAMTNSEYEDIANIFTTVAGNGRLMGDQLNQLSSRGINAAAALGKQMGYTESEIRKMVSKGSISFEMFANAMDDAFGEHAKDANKTFTGSMSNIRAAFSRIGADFATPVYDNMIDPLNQFRLVVNKVRKSLTPFSQEFARVFKIISERATKALEAINSDNFKFKALDNLVNMLTEFLKFDGVTYVINGIIQSLSNLGAVVGTVKNAFEKFFPAMSGKRFAALASIFEDLMKALKPSDAVLSRLERAFSGVFAVLDIGAQAIKALMKPFAVLIAALKNIGMSFLDTAASMGDWLVNLDKMIESSGIFNRIADTISMAIVKIYDSVRIAILYIKDFFKTITANVRLDGFSAITQIFGKIKDSLTQSGGIFDTVKTALSSFFESLKNSIGSSEGIFAKLVSLVSNAFTSIGKALAGSNIAGAIKEIFTTFIQYATKFAGMIASLGMLDQIRRIALQIQKIVAFFKGDAGGLVANAKTALSSLDDTLVTMQKGIKIGFVVELAIAVGILAASLTKLSRIDQNALSTSLATLSALMGETLGALLLFSKLSTFDVSLKTATKSLVIMGAAIWVLAKAMQTIASIPEDALLNSLLTVSILLAELTGVMFLMGGMSATVPKASLTLVGMAAAVLILSKAFKSLSDLSLPEIGKGLLAIGASLVILGTGLKFMGGTAILGATALTIASVGLIALSGAMKIMGNMDMAEIGKALLTLAGSLVILAGGLTLMIAALPGAAALAIASVSLIALAGALKLLGMLKMSEIGKGLLAIGGTLIILAVGLTAMIAALPGAAALTIAAAGLMMLAPALKVLGSMSIGEIAKALLTLFSAMSIMAVVGTVMTAATVGLLAFGAAVMMLGGGLILIGTGLASFASGITMLATLAPAAVNGAFAAIEQFFTNLLLLIPRVGTTIGEALVNMVEMLGNAAPVIGQAFVKIGEAIIDAVGTLIPKMLPVVGQLFEGIISAISSHLPSLFGMVIEAISGILRTIGENMPLIIQSGVDIVVGFCEGLSSASVQIVDAAFQMMIDFINGLTSSIEANTPVLVASLNNLAQTMIKAVVTGLTGSSALADIIGAGANLVKGFIKGISDSVADVVNAAIGVAASAVDAVKTTLGIHSPSKVFEYLAEMCGVGFTGEMDNQAKKAENSGNNFGEAVFGGASDAVNADGKTLLDDVKFWDDSVIAEKEGFLSSLFNLNAQAEGQIKSFDKNQHKLYEQYKTNKAWVDKMHNAVSGNAAKNADFAAKTPVAAQNAIKQSEALMAMRDKEAKNTKAANDAIIASDEKAADAKKGSGSKKKKAQEQELKDYNGYWAAYLKQQQEGVDAAKYKDMELQDFMKNTLNESKTIVENYMKEYESAVNGFMTKSIFEEIQKKEEVKAEDLKKNLNAHLSELREYRTTLYELHKKVEDEKFWQVIDQFGMDGLESLKALNKMAPEELQGVADTVQTYYHEAQTTALVTTENSMRQAEQQLNSLLGITNADLKQFIQSWGGTWETLNSYVQKSIDTGKSMVTGFTEAAKTEMKDKAKPDLEREGALMADDLGEEYEKDMEPAGENAVDGLVKGATSSESLKKAKNAGKEVGDEFMEGYNEATDTHSPSRMFMKFGGFAVDGLVLGVQKAANKAYEAGKNLGDSAMDAMRTALDKASYQIDMMDTQPVIRPIMDLSDIQNGISDANSMMKGINGFNISGTAAMANSSAMMMNRGAGSVDFTAQALYKMQEALKNMEGNNQTITNTFNITGNNPKEIADEVSRRIQMQVERRSAVWA